MNSSNYQSISWAHQLVQDWFVQNVGKPTEPQKQGWPFILAGRDTLISSPTGSGKTLAAFLACLNGLVHKAVTGNLQDTTEVLYVSPLKALSNDVQKNLLLPLQEISELAKEQGIDLPEIRVAVRTGDTPTNERQKMLKKPPHILITTPESFYILLTAEKSRMNMSAIHTVIVDEIHALVNNKRGTHLALSLERLEALTPKSFIRIGLSATQKPLEKVANFLVGSKKTQVKLVNIGHSRQLDLQVVIPESELTAVASNEMWDEIYEKITGLAQENRATLVFVNTRKLAERVAHHLGHRLGENKVLAHHGSLSRKLRLEAENQLKNGSLKVLVATASLELGIDIGHVDLVCQIGSPRAIATALQRIGRAGHWHAAISRGRIFATTRDELLECAALVYAIRQGDLDQLIIPEEPLDILAQQIVAACATQDWDEDLLFRHFKKAYPYHHLTHEKFDEILTMLSDGIAGSRGRYGAFIHRDRVNHILKGRRGCRLAAITSGGAIPDNGLFSVISMPDNAVVGTLDEDFAVESNRDDIFLLGTNSWRVIRIENGRVLVEDAYGAPPSVPFWLGEAPARSVELSLQVSQLREKINFLLPEKIPKIVDARHIPQTQRAIQWLMNYCGLDASASEQLLEYVRLGRQILGAVPTQKTIIAERFFDESGGMQLIIHAPFGARINKAWGLALRKKFCRSFNFELQAAATDNGLNISLTEQHSFPLSDVFRFLHTNTLKEVVTQAVLQSPLLGMRFRAVASRSLSLLRFRGGKKIPPNIQRMLADDLLAAVFPDAAACQDNLGGRDVALPEHPLIEETMKDILRDALDIDGVTKVIHDIETKHITCIAVDTPVPSVFAHEILNTNPYAFLDDAPLEERRSRAVEMRRVLPESMLEEVGKLDPKAIFEVQEQAWPDIRSADELQDVLHTVIVFPEIIQLTELQSSLPQWKQYFIELQAEGRAVLAVVAGINYYVSTEKKKTFHCIFPSASFSNEVANIKEEPISSEEAILKTLQGWLLHTGPITQKKLSDCLHLAPLDVAHALLKLEASGYVLRGHFRAEFAGEREWCERRLLARIHRATTESLRQQIKPVSQSQFMAWLLKWQHIGTGHQMNGERGLLAVIRQLQGFELAANAWETDIFPMRVHDYDALMLDKLCMNGTVGWGRVSPHPSVLLADEETKKSRRLSPARNAPITFFVREEVDWIPPHLPIDNVEEVTSLSYPARNIYRFLQKYGASFYADIVRGTGNLKIEVENGLWELVVAGMVTADSFDNVRSLMRIKRKQSSRRRRAPMFPLSTGRWSLLHVHVQKDHEKRVEAACWMLLGRYGVIFRDLLVREKNIPRWRDLLIFLRRLELRGEVRGGRFIDGFLGEQFALPYAVDSLRAVRNDDIDKIPRIISSVDPLNLIGILLPGERVSATSKAEIRFVAGRVLATENKEGIRGGMMHKQLHYAFLNKQKLPLLIQAPAEDRADSNDLVRYLKEENILFKEYLLQYHAIIFRGFNINTPEQFRKVIQASNLGANYNYDFCPVPRTKIQEGVFTSSNYPASYPIALHNEKSYSAEFPTHVFFNCIKAAEQGGCTSLADGHQIWLSLPESLQQKLQLKGVLYRRHYYSYGIKYKLIQLMGVAPVFKTWMEEFNTYEKEQVENILHQTQQQFKWKGNDLVTEVFLPASRKHPITGKLVWFNQCNQLSQHCNGISDYINSSVKNPVLAFILLQNSIHPYLAFYGDGTSFSKQESLLISEAVEKNTLLVSWQPGDLMIIDNYSCLHGKTPHIGDRLILAGMTHYPYGEGENYVS